MDPCYSRGIKGNDGLQYHFTTIEDRERLVVKLLDCKIE